MKKEILKTYWFTSNTEDVIGIVIIDNGFEKKAYIKNVPGISEKEDIQTIIDYGTKLPIQMLEDMINILKI